MTERAPHPVTVHLEAERAESWQLRLADRITSFAGSMAFVWWHVVLFALWIVVFGTLLKVDEFPFNFLTMTVSLEAIFLSTFVMIGQNRQAQYAEHKAAHDFEEQETELHLNTEITQAVHDLVTEIHRLTVPTPKV